MLLPMLVLFLPPTSCLFLLPLLCLVASGAWTAVAASGIGFAVGTAAIAVLYIPCPLCKGGGESKDTAVASLCYSMLYLLRRFYDS